MGRYQITDPKLGKTLVVEGSRPPTQTEAEKLFEQAMPRASIAERAIANALFTGDENARKAYLMQRGKSPTEPGMFTSPRETLADIVESAGPAAKLAGQVGGEVFGSQGGPGGFVLGGGAGRGAVQAGVEGIADVAGMGTPGAAGRVAKEANIGAMTSLGGKVLSKGFSMAKNIPLIKKGEEYMLTNITKMSKGMQEWVKGRWTEVYNASKEPLRILAQKVEKEVIRPIRLIRSDFGKKLTIAKKDAFMAATRPNFVGIAGEMKDEVLPGYFGNITTREAKAILNLAKKLEKSNVAKTSAQKGYIKAMDSLTELQRKITSGFSKLSPDDMRSTNAITAIFRDFKRRVTDRAKATSPELAKSLDDYVKFADLIDEWDTYVGHDKKTILGFFTDHLFGDESEANIYGRDAITAMFTPEYLGEGNLFRIRDLVASSWMRGKQVATSGYKAFLPTVVGSGVGATAGQILGGKEGRVTGAKIGAGIGGALTLPYVTPALASGMYKILEKGGPAMKALDWFAMRGLLHGPKLLTTPLGEALNELSGSFGIDATVDDINKLRSSKIK